MRRDGRVVPLILALGALLAATLSADEAGADPPIVARMSAWWQLHGAPRWSGPLLILLGAIPLFYGWRLIRWSMALVAAGVSSGAVLSVTLPVWDASLAWTAAIAAAIICGVLGFFLYQALVAIQLGACAAYALAALVLWCIPHFQVGALVLGLIGALVGGVIGWRVAPLLGIIETVLYGAGMMIEGMAILIGVESDAEFLLLATIVSAVTILAGMIVQLRSLRRDA